MSTLTQTLLNGNMAILDEDRSKVFIFSNDYRKENFRNDSGAVGTFAVGTVLGRISAAGANQGKVKPLVSGAVDGSDEFIGILAEPVKDLADGSDVEVQVCIKGEVAEEKVVIDAGDNLDTTFIDGRTLRDKIHGNTLGILLVPSRDHTRHDNS